MSFLKKLTAVMLSTLMLVSVVGCGEKEDNKDDNKANLAKGDSIGEDQTLKENNMPYGATVSKVLPRENNNCRVGGEYDTRFLSEEELIMLGDYAYALSTGDTQVFESVVHPDYVKNIIQEGGYADTADYLKKMYEGIRDTYIGEEFEFDYVLTTNCLVDEDNDFSSADIVIAEALGDDFIKTVTTRKLVTLDFLYTLKESGGSYSLYNRQLSYINLYIYEADGKLYIF